MRGSSAAPPMQTRRPTAARTRSGLRQPMARWMLRPRRARERSSRRALRRHLARHRVRAQTRRSSGAQTRAGRRLRLPQPPRRVGRWMRVTLTLVQRWLELPSMDLDQEGLAAQRRYLSCRLAGRGLRPSSAYPRPAEKRLCQARKK